MAQRRILASLVLLVSVLAAAAAARAQQPPAPTNATPAAESRIQIMSATLGRPESKTCDAIKAVAQQCDGKSRCRVTVADTLCDQPLEPNPLIATLRVGFRCNPKDSPRNTAVDRPLDMTIVCRRKTQGP